MNAPALNTLALLPALGAAYEGGLFAGLTTDKEGRHFAIALLPDKPDAKLAWKKAVDWADSVGGVLPTRPVAALLFANAKDQFEPEWHWTSEAFDGSYAWSQYFYYGFQGFSPKSYEGRARAVRLIQLTA
jgi:hypothetical protein